MLLKDSWSRPYDVIAASEPNRLPACRIRRLTSVCGVSNVVCHTNVNIVNLIITVYAIFVTSFLFICLLYVFFYIFKFFYYHITVNKDDYSCTGLHYLKTVPIALFSWIGSSTETHTDIHVESSSVFWNSTWHCYSCCCCIFVLDFFIVLYGVLLCSAFWHTAHY